VDPKKEYINKANVKLQIEKLWIEKIEKIRQDSEQI